MEVWLVYGISCLLFCAACLYFIMKIRPLFLRYFLASLLCLLNAMPVKVGVSFAPLLAVLAVDVISAKFQLPLVFLPLVGVLIAALLLALLFAYRAKKIQVAAEAT
jgi:hypothetical protein